MRAALQVTPTMPLVVRRSRHRWRAIAILLACGWLGDRYALPALAGRGVQRALATSGYPDARFEVERVGLGTLQLRDVKLADGVDLGRVELDVGVSALWGRRPAQATVTGARVALEALRPPRGGGGAALRRVRVEDAELTRGRDRATVTGEISLGGPLAADLRATGLRIGGLAVDAAALRVRGSDGGGYGAVWQLAGAGWTAKGEGALAWAAGALALVQSHTELRARALRAGAVSLEDAEVALDASGPLAALDVRGDARAARLALAGPAASLTLRDVRVPIAVRASYADGALAVIGRALIAGAAEATLAAGGKEVRATGIEVELVGGDPADAAAAGAAGGAAGAAAAGERTLIALGRGAAWSPELRWRADTARAGALVADGLAGSYAGATGAHAIAWRSAAARSLALGAGAIEFRRDGAQLRIERARLAVAGGELTAGPATLDLAAATGAAGAAPADLVVTARGIKLARLLPGHAVEATAVLDGEAALRIGPAGATFVRGELHARGRGTIRVTDPALREKARAMGGLQQRLVGAFTDFEHTALAAELAPPGSEPELRVTARGRGARIPQELDLAINFRGAWAAMDRLARSYR